MKRIVYTCLTAKRLYTGVIVDFSPSNIRYEGEARISKGKWTTIQSRCTEVVCKSLIW
jgi:hypothetical protein